MALWHFLALHYCVGRDSRAFGDHWVSGSLKGAMRALLHVLVVLLCSACTSPPLSCLPFFFFNIVLFIIYPVGSPLFFQFSVTGVGSGAGAGAGAGAGFFWQAGLVTGLQVGQCLLLLLQFNS